MIKVLVKGAGDLASGVALAFHQSGFQVLMTEVAQPTVIRRTVAFASCVFDGETEIEGVAARRAEPETYQEILKSGKIGVLVDPEAKILGRYRPDIVVDAILAKRNLGTKMEDAPVVIGLGPGFTAGKDCHLVVETKRGHDLARVISRGSAVANTGIPGVIGGKGLERVLYAPAAGTVLHYRKIGDLLEEGDPVLEVSGRIVKSPFPGVLRGLIQEGLEVPSGMKIGDVDPRMEPGYCHSISDKARAIGRGALEGALMMGLEKKLFGVRRFE